MRVALVTGAARGVGAATVHRLVADGHHVVALDSCEGTSSPYPLPTVADLDAVAAPYDDRVLPVVADVCDQATLAEVVADTVDRWGRLDVAVAAAAVVRGGAPLWETADDDLDLLLDVAVHGVWNTAAVVVPAMLGGPDPAGCRVVVLAPAPGEHAALGRPASTVAGHAVIGMVRGLAADLVGTGVTAVAVAPGRAGTAEADDLAATVAFCCSREGAALHGSVVTAGGV